MKNKRLLYSYKRETSVSNYAKIWDYAKIWCLAVAEVSI